MNLLLEGPVFTAVVLSLMAGVSTGLGGLVAVMIPSIRPGFLSFAMGFASGVMDTVSLGDLLPEAYASCGIGSEWIVAGMMAIGMVFAAIIERMLPDPKPDGDAGRGRAMRVGVFSMAALMLHNLPEGMATFMAAYQDTGLGMTVASAIALHNIPEGICVAVPVWYGTGSRTKAVGYALLSGLTEPLGALLTFLLLSPFITAFLLGEVFAFAAGIMLYISLASLLPAAGQYGCGGMLLAGILSGTFVMAFA